MSKKYFINCTSTAVYTATEDVNKIDFYLKHGWKEVSYESILLFGYRMIRTDFFLKNLVEMSQEERIEVLEETEEDFNLVGPSYCFDETDGFGNDQDMEMLFKIYGISYSEHCSIEPNDGDCYYSSDLSGKVIGKYVLEH